MTRLNSALGPPSSQFQKNAPLDVERFKRSPQPAAATAARVARSVDGMELQRPLAGTVAQAVQTGALAQASGVRPAKLFAPVLPPTVPSREPPDADLGVVPPRQTGNGCGTCSLASVMSYWDMPRTQEQIDASIRPFDFPTAPDGILSYARANGLRAEMKNDATVDDLVSMVDQGVPPMVLIDPDGGGNPNLHYVTVTGYERDERTGEVTHLLISNTADGSREWVEVEDFEREWGNLHMAGIPTGLNNVMITTVPNDGRMITGADGVQRPASDIELPTSSFFSNAKALLARGVMNALWGVGELIQRPWNIVGNIATGVSNAIGAIGGAVGGVVGAIGGAVSNVGQALGGFLGNVASGIANVATGFWNWLTGW